MLEHVFNWREPRGQTAANHKRIFCCIDCRGLIAYSRMTITTLKIARLNSLLYCTNIKKTKSTAILKKSAKKNVDGHRDLTCPMKRYPRKSAASWREFRSRLTVTTKSFKENSSKSETEAAEVFLQLCMLSTSLYCFEMYNSLMHSRHGTCN